MAGFSILLPPSRVQQSGGNLFAPKMFDRRSSNTFNYFVGLNPERRMVIEAANALELSKGRLAKALGVDSDQLEHALECNQEAMTNPLMSALDRFSPGVMYQALDFENLPTGAQRRLLEHGIIFSSLFGLLRPDDLVPEHYLRHETKLPELGKVKDFWHPFVTEALNNLVADHVVWNLLPDELLHIWQPQEESAVVVNVEFYRQKKGELEPVTEDLETLHGGFVNMLVRGPADSIEALEEQSHPNGYDVDLDRSKVDEETRKGVVVLARR